jgi:hypothetical protein
MDVAAIVKNCIYKCKIGMTIRAIYWTGGNKKALVIILTTEHWEKFCSLPKFDSAATAATYKIITIYFEADRCVSLS